MVPRSKPTQCVTRNTADDPSSSLRLGWLRCCVGVARGRGCGCGSSVCGLRRDSIALRGASKRFDE